MVRPKNTRDLSNDVYVTHERDATRPIFFILSQVWFVFCSYIFPPQLAPVSTFYTAALDQTMVNFHFIVAGITR